jgi:hypothetical protein
LKSSYKNATHLTPLPSLITTPQPLDTLKEVLEAPTLQKKPRRGVNANNAEQSSTTKSKIRYDGD